MSELPITDVREKMAEAGNSRLPGLLGKLGKMTSIRDTEVLEQSLLRTLGPLLGVLDTSLYRTDEQQNMVRVINYHRSKVIEADGVARMVERVEEVSRLNDLPAEVIALTDNVRLLGKPCTRKVGKELLVAYPLFGGNDVCGYFVFQRDREVQAAEDATIRGVLEVFSNYYALLDISQRDRLTGLFNRQALEGSFERIWRVLGRPDHFAEREDGRRTLPGENYWLAVIDIDHFKKINDGYGHDIGDAVLRNFYKAAAAAIRPDDMLGRAGGEEWLLVMPVAQPGAEQAVFERMRNAVANMPSDGLPAGLSVSFSMGVARLQPGEALTHVLRRADLALYEAKQSGRDRMAIAA